MKAQVINLKERLNQKSEKKEQLLKIDKDGFLLLFVNGKYEKVELKPCFPWTTPNKHLALVDKEGKEKKFINSIDDLDEKSQECIKMALVESGFCFEVTHIEKIEEEFELRRWWGKTKQGDRQFQTKLLDWPRLLPNKGVLIQDLYGDLYYVSDLSGSNVDKKGLLTAFID